MFSNLTPHLRKPKLQNLLMQEAGLTEGLDDESRYQDSTRFV